MHKTTFSWYETDVHISCIPVYLTQSNLEKNNLFQFKISVNTTIIHVVGPGWLSELGRWITYHLVQLLAHGWWFSPGTLSSSTKNQIYPCCNDISSCCS